MTGAAIFAVQLLKGDVMSKAILDIMIIVRSLGKTPASRTKAREARQTGHQQRAKMLRDVEWFMSTRPYQARMFTISPLDFVAQTRSFET